MTDLDLLAFGCAISFITAAGFYVYARASFAGTEKIEALGPRPVPAPVPVQRERRLPRVSP